MVGEPMCLSVTRRFGSPPRAPRELPGSKSTSPRIACATASLTLSLWAIRVLMPRRTPFRVISAGALTGVAAFFTQTGGAAAVIALLFALLWEHFAYGKSWSVTLKRIMLLVTAFGLVWLALSAPFIVSAGWQRF